MTALEDPKQVGERRKQDQRAQRYGSEGEPQRRGGRSGVRDGQIRRDDVGILPQSPAISNTGGVAFSLRQFVRDGARNTKKATASLESNEAPKPEVHGKYADWKHAVKRNRGQLSGFTAAPS